MRRLMGGRAHRRRARVNGVVLRLPRLAGLEDFLLKEMIAIDRTAVAGFGFRTARCACLAPSLGYQFGSESEENNAYGDEADFVPMIAGLGRNRVHVQAEGLRGCGLETHERQSRDRR